MAVPRAARTTVSLLVASDSRGPQPTAAPTSHRRSAADRRRGKNGASSARYGARRVARADAVAQTRSRRLASRDSLGRVGRPPPGSLKDRVVIDKRRDTEERAPVSRGPRDERHPFRELGLVCAVIRPEETHSRRGKHRTCEAAD